MKISIIYHSETGNVKSMAEIIAQGCKISDRIDVKCMSITDLDVDFISQSKAVMFGSPTYSGNCSWQLKKYLDYHPKELAGKLGGVFVSQNWPGGGGASFAAMSIIAELLVSGMLVYSGGISNGKPIIHFGAISEKSPKKGDLYYERCIKLGENITKKAMEIFNDQL